MGRMMTLAALAFNILSWFIRVRIALHFVSKLFSQFFHSIGLFALSGWVRLRSHGALPKNRRTLTRLRLVVLFPSQHPIGRQKNRLQKEVCFLFKMGRMMGFEPMYIGTTTRGLNPLATPAILRIYYFVFCSC